MSEPSYFADVAHMWRFFTDLLSHDFKRRAAKYDKLGSSGEIRAFMCAVKLVDYTPRIERNGSH